MNITIVRSIVLSFGSCLENLQHLDVGWGQILDWDENLHGKVEMYWHEPQDQLHELLLLHHENLDLLHGWSNAEHLDSLLLHRILPN